MKTTKIFIGLKALVSFVVLGGSISCETGNATEATDYSIPSHWMAVPAATNKPVDVFYFYPTSWTSTNPNPEVCAIDNPSMLAQAPQQLAIQATAFETVGNIFAPFYRQSNLVTNAPTIVAGIPTTDGMAAFDYYLRHFNHGRPFILCGHSQGANVLNNLLAQYMKTHPAVLARMIVAYVIGYPVTAQYLADNPYLKFAEGPGDTGVIVSYNTEAPGIPPGMNPVLWGLVGTVINPLTWTRTETLAATNQGFGSFMPGTNGVYGYVPQYADARIDISKGVLICSTANTNALGRINALAGYGIFHIFDYPFYYFNLRSNAVQRTQNFLQKIGADYDADGKADPVVYDAAGGILGVFLSGNSYSASSVIMDLPSTLNLQPVAGDFDGDSKADPAVYDPIANQLLARFSSQSYSLNMMSIGNSSCVPVSGDFDGDCKADPALYSATTGQMTVWLSGTNYTASIVPLGGAGWINASADYDGDGKTDPAVYESSSGTCQVLLSGSGYTQAQVSLQPSTVSIQPVPGDYDGDGKADPAVFQPATGLWLIALSSQGYSQTLFDGLAGSTFLARSGDYDGDGKTDPAVYAPGLNAYCVWMSASGYNAAILSW